MDLEVAGNCAEVLQSAPVLICHMSGVRVSSHAVLFVHRMFVVRAEACPCAADFASCIRSLAPTLMHLMTGDRRENIASKTSGRVRVSGEFECGLHARLSSPNGSAGLESCMYAEESNLGV